MGLIYSLTAFPLTVSQKCETAGGTYAGGGGRHPKGRVSAHALHRAQSNFQGTPSHVLQPSPYCCSVCSRAHACGGPYALSTGLPGKGSLCTQVTGSPVRWTCLPRCPTALVPICHSRDPTDAWSRDESAPSLVRGLDSSRLQPHASGLYEIRPP